jgi:hypothetical protein
VCATDNAGQWTGGIMTSSGILAFLADRFNVRSREEFATDGLGYLLQEYPVVRDIVINALSTSSIAPETRTDIAFISQARSADDSWVVDLEGRIDERVYISVEGKLDAHLQPSQPVEYMKRLQDGGSLVLVCPSGRISRLQKELEQRAGNDDLLEPNASWGRPGAARISWIPLTKRQKLGIMSWNNLLKLIRDGAGDGLPALQSDIYQLERLVARYELELEPWTADELRNGGLGPTFGKALLATRMLCEIISAQMRTSIRPAWTATASDVRISRDFWDWYGGKVSLPDPAGGLLAVSFDPLLWGQDDASTPLRLSFLTRGLPRGTIDLLYPVYLQMIARANESLGKLGAGSAIRHDRSDDWWVVPFPLRAELAGDESREDMTRSAADLLKPLLDLIAPHP